MYVAIAPKKTNAQKPFVKTTKREILEIVSFEDLHTAAQKQMHQEDSMYLKSIMNKYEYNEWKSSHCDDDYIITGHTRQVVAFLIARHSHEMWFIKIQADLRLDENQAALFLLTMWEGGGYDFTWDRALSHVKGQIEAGELSPAFFVVPSPQQRNAWRFSV